MMPRINWSQAGRGLYRAGLRLLERRRWALPLGLTLTAWLAVRAGWLNQLGNAVSAGIIGLVDALMQALIHLAGPLIALWILWQAVGKILGTKKR